MEVPTDKLTDDLKIVAISDWKRKLGEAYSPDLIDYITDPSACSMSFVEYWKFQLILLTAAKTCRAINDRKTCHPARKFKCKIKHVYSVT